MFGGTWSLAPDPSDFHDFLGVDLNASNANLYVRPDGTAYPVVRDNGQVFATIEQYAKAERVMGAYGGQLTSFEWVFSPRGADGRPVPMFDRDTGVVDQSVVTYWRDNFDIAWQLAHNWPALRPHLDGKIRVIIGTEDNYYLDASARRLKTVLDDLGANAQVTFLDGRDHNDIYRIGVDPFAWKSRSLGRCGR